MLKESTAYATETADAVYQNSMVWDFQDYLNVGYDRMEEPQFDDITMVSFTFLGSDPGRD